jgi:hypothetical protein
MLARLVYDAVLVASLWVAAGDDLAQQLRRARKSVELLLNG